jgi:DMSO/TMAO reductase YedYZ molybdopterin-dependent catalytic subunit
MTLDRRVFLAGSAAGVASALLPRLPFSPWARADGTAELLELTSRPANYESARDTFTSRITPLPRFYVRSHFDAPPLDAATWRLRVSGLVERPLALSLAELERMPQVTVEAVLQCCGNGRALFEPRVPGVQWRWGAMGNAEWTGVRLRDVLALAGPKPDGKHVQIAGADRPVLDATPRFVRGIPVERALHEGTLVALRMNGRPLAPHHGFPARLVVPGWVADDWMKWLSDVEVRALEPTGFFYETAYRFPLRPGAPGAPVAPADTRPMTRLFVKSIIGSLAPGQPLTRGAHDLVGVAFSGEAGIDRVEVTVDGGARWQPAALDGPATPYGFRVFRFPWRPEAPGHYRVASRATDTTGAVQPQAPVWNPSGYLFNAVEYLPVEVVA